MDKHLTGGILCHGQVFIYFNDKRMSANTSSKQRSRLLLGGCFLLKCRFVQNVHLALKRNI